jgi:hypothetical protein
MRRQRRDDGLEHLVAGGVAEGVIDRLQAIDALHQSPAPDLLRLLRLKKRKLQLRDRIAFIEDQFTPDIIA